MSKEKETYTATTGYKVEGGVPARHYKIDYMLIPAPDSRGRPDEMILWRQSDDKWKLGYYVARLAEKFEIYSSEQDAQAEVVRLDSASIASISGDIERKKEVVTQLQGIVRNKTITPNP